MSDYSRKLTELDECMRALGRPLPPVGAWLANGQRGDFNARTAAWKSRLVEWERANPEAAVDWLELREAYAAEEESEEARKWSVDEYRYRLLGQLGAPAKCIETIRRDFQDKPPMKAASGWCFNDAQWALTLCGRVGNGKTTAATWAAHQHLMRGRRVHWVRCAKMADEPLFGVEAQLQKHRCREAPLLVLDDIGAGARETSAKAWLGWLDDVLDARWGAQRKTILTSNLAPGALATWLGPRLADRLNEGLIHGDNSESMRGAA